MSKGSKMVVVPIRMSPDMLDLVEEARKGGLFEEGRSEFIRNAVRQRVTEKLDRAAQKGSFVRKR